MTIGLSVVVLSWNTRDLLRACLQSLSADDVGRTREIIVVDNASDDGSADLVASEFPDVRLIRNDANLLYSEGNNVGARVAEGEYLCLLNSDTEVDPGTLEALCRFLDENPDYGMVGPMLRNPDGSLQKACRRLPGLAEPIWEWSWLRRTPWARRAADRGDMKDFDHLESADVEQPLGACVVMKRTEYLELPGLDPDLSLFFNDVDLCKRLLQRGRRIRYLADVSILHHRGASTKKRVNEFGSWLWHQNRIAYYRKHHGWLGQAMMRAMLRLSLWNMRLRILAGRRKWQDKRATLSRLSAFAARSLARDPQARDAS